MLRHLLVSFVLVALVGGVYFLFTTEGRQLIDRVHINLDRAKYKSLHEAGTVGDVARVRAEAGVNIESAYVTVGGNVVLSVDDLAGAMQVASGMAVTI